MISCFSTSFDPSFNVNSWAVALVELVEMIFVELDETEVTRDEDFIEHVFSKVFQFTLPFWNNETKKSHYSYIYVRKLKHTFFYFIKFDDNFNIFTLHCSW